MLVIIAFFILHWYFSLFFQTFFLHRYAAHGMFTMSKFWEKTFHIGAFLSQGSSYLSPYAYGVMHKMHHAYADTEKDPHSPKFDKTLMEMMFRTRKIYNEISTFKLKVTERFTLGVPSWHAFDLFAGNIWTRIVWALVYILIYIKFAPSAWFFLLVPIHIAMGPVHGAIINWFNHKFGYRNFEVSDTSTNLLPIEIFTLGEGLHNNHHKNGQNPNFAHKWFEFDPTYQIIKILDFIKVIKLVK
ncbi:MAG: acyl-CoA desaturase [Flavobacteriaceae bacterium]|nr:MAG: acyl-CoA desaturase [Flavobacteriaceae bacterium]